MITDTERLDWLQNYFAIHEGGIMGSVSISWDDATRDFIISLRTWNREHKIYENKTLGCSSSLRHAFELAATGKVYDPE